jgi:hypothetical protein
MEGMMAEETRANNSTALAVAAIATVILAILGLAHVVPNFLVAIATITFGAALLLHGAAMLGEYANLARQVSANGSVMLGGGGLSAVLLAGAAGVILGILALLGVSTVELVAIAVIAFGSALILSSNSALRLHFFRLASAKPATGAVGEMLAGEMLSSSAGTYGLVGLAAIVLGILALAGFAPVVLVLIALLALGGVSVVNGIDLGGLLVSTFQRA